MYYKGLWQLRGHDIEKDVLAYQQADTPQFHRV